MLRTILFYLVVFFSTVWSTFVVMLVGLFKRHTNFSHRFVFKPWGESILWAAGIKVDIYGSENINKDHSYVIVSNHQSHMDIPVLAAKIPLKLTIIAKKELFKIPVFSQGMRAFGILEIDRSNRTKAIETLQLAADVIRNNKVSVLAFPEGTRSEDGQLQPFKKGPFALALNNQIPILPVSVIGTFPILPKKRLRICPGPVKLIIHPPFDTGDYDDETRNQLINDVHQTIAAGLYENSKQF